MALGLGLRRSLPPSSKSGSSDSDAAVRSRLATRLIAIGTLGILVVSGISIWLAPNESRPEMTRLVFASVVPLFATWVGTVLAFYFARENLQAATDSTVRLNQMATGAQTTVNSVMIARSSIKSMSVVDAADAGVQTIASIVNELDNGKVNRMPILTGADVVLYVVHRSTLMRYADTLNKDLSALTTETLSDLLGVSDLAALIMAIGFVREDAFLAEARSALNSVAGCNDVFVTATGKPGEPVLGWITNTLLAGMQ